MTSFLQRGTSVLTGAILFAFPLFARAGDPAPASAVLAPPPPAPTPPSVPRPHAYGILVGTNAGGSGQADLRYAEEDARRMADVLRDLGRYGTADMRVLVRPDAARVLATVEEIGAKLRAHRAKGEQAILVFYYSGHAKANAFSLGRDELPIAKLRERLRELPTTLTLVVLDACQSGQFARIKGAEPAADFSFNSVARLTTKGIAVMASSTAEELSQESDELHSSYFTHHLIVALRGAADSDRDGRVSLDEAYRYAYRRTLLSTSKTQIGGQHVTLETDLSGQGDVPVTYPVDARSQLELPAALEARVLVEHKPSGNIVAEVQKAAGSPLRLALTAGAYEAVVRRRAAPRVVRCALTLIDARATSLDLGGCEEVKLAGGAKGQDDEDEVVAPRDAPPDGVAPDVPAASAPRAAPPAEVRAGIDPWQVESGFGLIVRQEDAYTSRLREFGYRAPDSIVRSPRIRFHAGASKGIAPHLSVGAIFHTLAGDRYERTLSDSADSFAWGAYGLSAFVRASTTPIGKLGPRSSHLEVYAQGAVGLALGVTTLVTGSSRPGTEKQETTDTSWGWALGGHGGLAFATRTPLVFFLQGGYEYAPAISNLVGDTHNSGGPSFQIGARFRFE